MGSLLPLDFTPAPYMFSLCFYALFMERIKDADRLIYAYIGTWTDPFKT